MNRRGFLSTLTAFAAAATLDPERALWVRGAKTISIPKPVISVDEGISIRYVSQWNQRTCVFNNRIDFSKMMPMKSFHETYLEYRQFCKDHPLPPFSPEFNWFKDSDTVTILG